jgi:hypothetical protein
MKHFKKGALALGCASALTLYAASASAAIVCNESEGVCWRTETVYEYPAEAGVVVHEDSWQPHARFTFREHSGRGYWRGGTWRTW